MLDIGVERYSSPFFFEPYYGAKIPCDVASKEEGTADDEMFVYGDWVIEKMRQFGEFKDLFTKKASKEEVA